MVSFRVALSGLLSTVVLASCPFAAKAQRNDPAAIAGDAAAFKRLRAEIAQRNQAREAALRPAQMARHAHLRTDGCQIKPVMTDREIDACRSAKR